jgi:predicted lipid-binding transport protein (Tim44 family)
MLTLIAGIGLLGIPLGLAACAQAEAVIPQEVYRSVNQSDRVQVYKATWQNTRALVDAIERTDIATISEIAPLLIARLDLLDNGKAGPLRDAATAELLEQSRTTSNSRNRDDNLRHLEELGQQIQQHFDDGDFTTAKNLALEVLATVQVS